MKNQIIKCGLIVILLLSGSFSGLLRSQNPMLNNDMRLFNAPSTTSPERASLDKFGSYPVDFSVGVPDISIPIYTIKSGTLNFPITLSYHLSGIKVDEIANWVGLGWSLNAYGAINVKCDGQTQTDSFRNLEVCQLYGPLSKDGKDIKDLISPISEKEFYKFGKTASMNEDKGYSSMVYSYINPIARDVLPTKAREYNYNVNGMSGYFSYNINRDLVQVPLTDRKIELSGTKCTITDETGDRYIFETKQNVEHNGSFDAYNRRPLSEDMLLTQIISFNNIDTINFKYTDYQIYTDESESFSFFAGKDKIAIEKGLSYDISETPFYTTNGRRGWNTYSKECLLSSIEFKSGIIEFGIGKRERDKIRDNQLNSISIWVKENNNKKKLLRKISFEYTSQDDARLFLNKLNIMGDLNDKIQEYKFTYHDGYSPYKSKGQDYWGYYNGKVQNISMVPKNFVPEESELYKKLSYEMADREPNVKMMKMGSLKRIDYPTGGYTMFDTEANRDEDDNILGGLRIFRIVSKASSESPETIQEFSYENPFILFKPQRSDYIVEKYATFYNIPFGNDSELRSYYIDSPSRVSSYRGNAATYGKVTKVDSGKEGNTNGKTIYYYQQPSIYTHIYEQIYSGYGEMDTRRNHTMPNLWKMGKQTKVEYYQGTEAFPSKIENYKYQTFKEKVEEIGFLLSFSIYNYPIEIPVFDQWGEPEIAIASINENPHIYNNITRFPRSATDYTRFHWYYANTGIEQLIEKQESIYDPINKQYTTTEYVYEYGNITTSDKINYLLTKEKVKDSKGNIIQTYYKYPQDFVNSGSVYSSMVTSNMISLPVEKIIERENKAISKSKIEYKQFPHILPNSLYTSRQGEAYQLEVTYDSYNKYGNLTQMTNQKDGVSTSFIWGYKGQYPIAEIKNIQYNDISKILTEPVLNNIMNQLEPSETDFKAINSLRQNSLFTNSLISTYKYKPLVGIKEEISSQGIGTYYDYDSYGRLKIIKDNDQKLLSVNEYKYCNNRFEENRPSLEPLNIDNFSGNLVCEANLEQEYWLTTTGGSGKYIYNWTVKDSTGKILSTNTNGRIKTTFPAIGDYIITCTVRDQKYSFSRTITQKVQVRPVVKFKDEKISNIDSQTQQLTANLYCPSTTTIVFELRVDKADCYNDMNYYDIEFRIGDKWYRFREPKTENVTLTIPQGNTAISITIVDNYSCGQAFSYMEIKKLESSSNLIGSPSRLINSYVH